MKAAAEIRLIRNGRVIDPAHRRDEVSDIYIDDKGRIAAQRPARKIPPRQTIDASDKWVIPGVIDLAARFREPGHEHKADLLSESRAALAAGVTGVCIPPDTMPVIDTPAVADLIAQKTRGGHYPRLFIIGAATVGLEGRRLSEMAALKAAGCVALSNADTPVADSRMQRNIMDYAAGLGIKLFLRPQDAALSAGCAHEGPVAERLGLPGIPAAAEVVALSRDLALVEATGGAAHFCRLSTARAVELVAEARRRGLSVTADVAAHQLFLTERDLAGFNPNMRLVPPLRALSDRDALRRGLADGVISAVCSDHQPHEADAKQAPFPLTEPGASALETLLPLLLKLSAQGVVPLQTALAAVTCNPAAVIGKPGGVLSPGAPADIAIIDPRRQWVFNRRESLSRGKNTPFDDYTFPAKVTHTLLGGRQLYGPPT